MSLPPSFHNSSDYFEACLKFFAEYEYLYNFPNTDILVNNVLDHIDITGLENVNTNDFVINMTPRNDYLNDFFTKLSKLQVDLNDFDEDEVKFVSDAPLSLKKKHEILYLSKEVALLCEDTECDTVVDFGCGLGYLDQQIFDTTTVNVLGLECNDRHYVGAKKRQREYHKESIDRVKFIKHTVTVESHDAIQRFLLDKFPNHKGFCITGLHACADLTVDAMSLFLKMEHARAMIIMPCCYHKIKGDNGRFNNFPLSECLKCIYERYSGFQYLRVPFLRLATQPTNIANESLEDLVFNMLARATLQVFAVKNKFTLKRKKRKAVRLKTIDNNFECYVRNALNGYSFVSNSGMENMQAEGATIPNIEELSVIWRENTKSTFKKAAIFILLQNAMQPVFENFFLYDRLLYLHENNIRDCEFKKIVSHRISPRCLALIVRK
ncbi:methyltransferase-like protein 25B isoform X2 [Leptidea sinapis]|uniref:methyltransferase-like protein 25B isoform X2 n=1 Tax=Leptidea sinapis TaxID=189913 RepID=UPI0021C41975|nr:methyltransferase-like protein 25B isoform X2 [Leptidea sinapis]